MKDSVLKEVAKEFAESGQRTLTKRFAISGTTDFVTIQLDRKSLTVATEAQKTEVRANTVSALPSGAQCGCCGGSGRG